MKPGSGELDGRLRAALAEAVAILWDEAQERPPLLRFLTPFGRPELRRLEREFGSAPSIAWLLGEPRPELATWLAAATVRLGLAVPGIAPVPEHRNAFVAGPCSREAPLFVTEASSVVVAGDLSAPAIVVDSGARLVVAGTLTCQTLASRGLVLVQQRLVGHTIAIGSPLGAPSARPVGWQVGEAVRAQVLDSPRYGLTCPVESDGVIRLVGRTPDRASVERARTRLSHECWRDDGQGVDVDVLIDLLVNGSAAVA
ncbi:MAG: hypothetical protein JNJ54_00205 [Myxococcaceae bacterium]|nr:hypothetical protein [Myxococcaceae bacterium]